MIKYSVTVGQTTTEFSDESVANSFAETHNSTVITINEDTSGIVIAEKKVIQESLLEEAWGYITPYYDPPAFIQMVDWKSAYPDHPVCDLIAAVEKWKNAVMYEYLMVKKQALWNDLPYDHDYTFIGEPPCSFTDIFLAVNAALQPHGWTVPDVSTYKPGTR